MQSTRDRRGVEQIGFHGAAHQRAAGFVVVSLAQRNVPGDQQIDDLLGRLAEQVLRKAKEETAVAREFDTCPLLGGELGLALAQQGSILEPELDLDRADDLGNIETVEEEQVAAAPGAVLRGLDKVTGVVIDIEMANGDTARMGRLEVTLGECRYPAGNPAGEAYAYLVIREPSDLTPRFEGWMIASSPALNALDHARYDVWLLRCKTA